MTGSKPHSLFITDRDKTLLRHLADAKIADRMQITSLIDFGSVSRANERFTKLTRAGLLRRHFVGTLAGGRKALYSLSPRGAAVIGQLQVWRFARANDELLIGDAFVEHQLAVNWCWIALDRHLEPRLVRFVRFNEPLSAAVPLVPDGYAELMSHQQTQALFLEVDLGTETSRIWDRKIELYLKLAISGDFENRFQQQRFKVAIVCTSQRRLDNLRRIVRKQTEKLFFFTLLTNINRDGFNASVWQRPVGDALQSIF